MEYKKCQNQNMDYGVYGIMEPHLILNFKPYKTEQETWKYLKKFYHRENYACQYPLEFEIAQYTQGISSITDYYTRFLALWAEYAEIKYANVSEEVLSEIQALQAPSHQDQFLMKLSSKYESVRSSIMSRVPSPSLDERLNELLCEEQWRLTQVALTQQGSGVSLEAAYSTSGRS